MVSSSRAGGACPVGFNRRGVIAGCNAGCLNSAGGAGVMAQWLSVLPALPGDPRLVPSTYTEVPQSPVNPALGAPIPFSGLHK